MFEPLDMSSEMMMMMMTSAGNSETSFWIVLTPSIRPMCEGTMLGSLDTILIQTIKKVPDVRAIYFPAVCMVLTLSIVLPMNPGYSEGHPINNPALLRQKQYADAGVVSFQESPDNP